MDGDLAPNKLGCWAERQVREGLRPRETLVVRVSGLDPKQGLQVWSERREKSSVTLCGP